MSLSHLVAYVQDVLYHILVLMGTIYPLANCKKATSKFPQVIGNSLAKKNDQWDIGARPGVVPESIGETLKTLARVLPK
jgi:hypothetical protein